MANLRMTANIMRSVLLKTQVLGTSLSVPVKNSNHRDPFDQDEVECLQLRFSMARRHKRRKDSGLWVVGFEIHCWSKRAEDRADHKTDRHVVLAGAVEDTFQELDLPIVDAVGGNTNTVLGILEMDETTTHFRDKRNTVFGTSVDYSVETPTSLQAVVVCSGLLIK